MFLDVQMEDGTPYKRYENGTFQQADGERVQDSARQPLPGQVGHCDYSPEGSEQVRPAAEPDHIPYDGPDVVPCHDKFLCPVHVGCASVMWET